MSSLIQAKDLEVNRQGKDILQNVSIDIKKKDFITRLKQIDLFHSIII